MAAAKTAGAMTMPTGRMPEGMPTPTNEGATNVAEVARVADEVEAVTGDRWSGINLVV